MFMLLGDGNDAVILWAGFANCADKQTAFELVALKPFNMPVIDFFKASMPCRLSTASSRLFLKCCCVGLQAVC